MVMWMRITKRHVTFLVINVLLISLSFAQVQEEQGKTEVKQGKLYLIPLPALAYNPVTGFMFGVAASGSMSLGNPSDTRLSSGMFTATYTTNQQLLITLKTTLYTKKDHWILMGDKRLFFSSQPTYGLGTGPQAEILLTEGGENFELGDYLDGVNEGELMEFNLFRFHETALRKIRPGLYIGVGYHFDTYWNIQDNLLDLDLDPPYITNHFAYNSLHGFDPESYIISGPSFNAVFDTRDNINNPYTGSYAFLQFRAQPTWLGSNQSANSLWLEYRDYFRLSKKVPRNLIAIWTYFNLTTSGRFPYMGLPALGWDQFGKSGRAYPQGRFRGENLFYFEAEYRFRIPILNKHPERFGGVVFANATTASAIDLDVKLFQYFKPGTGLGLRFMLNEATRSNITFDYGIGADGKGAFYFNINEYF